MQPVVDHRVERLAVAHAKAEARLREQVGSAATSTPCRRRRRPRPRRHGSPGRAADRAHAGGADLVDRLRGDLLRDAGVDLGLSRGDLALAGLEHLAHDHVLDLPGATSARSSAALIAVPPSSVASSDARPPPSLPIGVRAEPRITVLGMGRLRKSESRWRANLRG